MFTKSGNSTRSTDPSSRVGRLSSSLALVLTVLSGCGDPDRSITRGQNISTEQTENAGEDSLQIRGGVAAPNEFIEVVRLNIGRFGSCTGTLIFHDVVLTAQHCLPSNTLSDYKVEVQSPSNGLQTFNALKIVTATGAFGTHPKNLGVDLDYGRDLALIQIDSVPFQITPGPNQIPREFRRSPLASFEPLPGTTGTIVGYGVNETDSSTVTRRKGELKLFGTNIIVSFQQINGQNQMLHQLWLPVGKQIACPGDSGGPVFVKEGPVGQEQFVLAGVTSYLQRQGSISPNNLENCNAAEQNGYASVSRNRQWLSDELLKMDRSYRSLPLAVSTPAPLPTKLRVFQLYNATQDKYFLTTNIDERNIVLNSDKSSWYDDSEPDVCVFKQAGSTGASQVFRLYNPNSGSHYYTTSAGERDFLVRAGWNYEKDAHFGYAWPVNTAISQSLRPKTMFHMYRDNRDHFFTTSRTKAQADSSKRLEKHTDFGSVTDCIDPVTAPAGARTRRR
jgi:hypothetical protein